MKKNLFKALLLAGAAFLSTETVAMSEAYANMGAVQARVAASKLHKERDDALLLAAGARAHYANLHNGANESDAAVALRTVGKAGPALDADLDNFLAILSPDLAGKVTTVLNRIQNVQENAMLDAACPDIGGLFADANRNTFDDVLTGAFAALNHAVPGMPGAIVPAANGVSIAQLIQFKTVATRAVADSIAITLFNGGAVNDPYLDAAVLQIAKIRFVASLIPTPANHVALLAANGGPHANINVAIRAALNAGDMPGAGGEIDAAINAEAGGDVNAANLAIHDAMGKFGLFPVNGTRAAFASAIRRAITE